MKIAMLNYTITNSIAISCQKWYINAMKWPHLLNLIGNEPIFFSSVLLTGPVNSTDIGRQLSRWVSSGRLLQIRKGLYMLSDTYRKKTPHPFLVANMMKRASYVSLQSALAYYDLIPEYVPNVRKAFEAEAYNVQLKINEGKTVKSSFIRFPGLPYELGLSPHQSEVLAVKIELDTNPPTGGTATTTIIRRNILLNLFHHDNNQRRNPFPQ